MGKLPYELCAFYAAEIFSALEYLIKNKVVHRDLKPENILISDDWHLRLVTLKFIFSID